MDVLADDYDWILFELASGGYGVVQAKALEAAKSVTARRGLTVEEHKELRRGTADFQKFEAEVAPEDDPPEGDD